ncbi:MAG TPA: hypothetical protein VGJ60_16210 [Chloroflexota bacterium]|jgi:hypothetical protein
MHTIGEQKPEYRLVNPKLALNRFGCEANLPSNMLRAVGNQTAQNPELDPTSVVEREPVVPRGWKVDSIQASLQEVIDRAFYVDLAFAHMNQKLMPMLATSHTISEQETP